MVGRILKHMTLKPVNRLSKPFAVTYWDEDPNIKPKHEKLSRKTDMKYE